MKLEASTRCCYYVEGHWAQTVAKLHEAINNELCCLIMNIYKPSVLITRVKLHVAQGMAGIMTWD